MSDREKVIHGLKCIIGEPALPSCQGCKYYDLTEDFDDCVKAIAADALELLEPVELIDDGPDYRCSGCGEKIKGEIVYMVSGVRYCPNCGKAVKRNA